MIRRHPQRPQRRQFQDFHFFAAANPVANIDTQFVRPPQATQPPAPAPTPTPAPIIQPQEVTAGLPTVATATGEVNVADVIRRAAAYLANIDDPSELIGQPRPPFMDEIEALAATRPAPALSVPKNQRRRRSDRVKRASSPEGRDRPKANPLEASDGRSHHQRHCKICTHRDREEIEADFIEWHAPNDIVDEYKVSRAGLFRHARAVGLYARRDGNLRFALGRFIECVDYVTPTADSIVRAVHHFARLNDQGQWVEPPAHVIVSSGSVRREAAAGGHRPLAISLDSPALPSMIDISRAPVLPETAIRVETDATR
ncbi:MAG: hypothetical protein ACRD4X_17600 [Candidatus Acidiferrales bacterium]